MNMIKDSSRNFLPSDKFLAWSKLKAFAEDKHNLKTEIFSVMGRKHCWKRRKCWLPAFSPFPTFSKGFFSRSLLKVGIVCKGLTDNTSN